MSYADEAPPPKRRKPKTSGMAIASLVCGIGGLVTCGIAGLIGMILGIVAMVNVKNSHGRLVGMGLAIAGTAIGGVTLVLGFVSAALFFATLMPAVTQARGAAQVAVSGNNMKQLGMATHNFYDGNNGMPQGTSQAGADAGLSVEQRLSFIAQLLPYLERRDMYDGLDMAAPWNGPANGGITSMHLPVLQQPGVAPQFQGGSLTHYVGVAGYGPNCATLPVDDPRAGIYAYDRSTSFSKVTDGLSNTAMMAAVQSNFGPWGQGGNSTVRGFTAQPYIGGPDGFGSPGPRGGMQVLLGDGSVRMLSADTDPKVIEAISTIAGGESVQF